MNTIPDRPAIWRSTRRKIPRPNFQCKKDELELLFGDDFSFEWLRFFHNRNKGEKMVWARVHFGSVVEEGNVWCLCCCCCCRVLLLCCAQQEEEDVVLVILSLTTRNSVFQSISVLVFLIVGLIWHPISTERQQEAKLLICDTLGECTV